MEEPGRTAPQRPHTGAITATADPVPLPPLWLLLDRLSLQRLLDG